MSKYRNVKTAIDGKVFDSKREGMRYAELKLLQSAGKIAYLQCQKPFVLLEGVKLHGDKRKGSPTKYIADFAYADRETGEMVIEDVKGFDTDVSRLKRRMLKVLFGIDVRIIK